MIRVGIVGAGFMGRNHFNQYEKLSSRCKVVALCDKEADRRVGDWSRVGGNVGDTQGTRRELGDIRPCSDWRELVNATDIDLIDICAPTFTHREIVVEALRAGKSVLCEKPMALSVAECDEMIEAAQGAKGQFMIAQVIRFWPEYVYLRKVVEDRSLGELRALHLRRQASAPDYTLGNWIVNPELSGGAILDLHVHDVDFAISLFGKPRSVYAQGYQRQGGSVDRVHASWDYGEQRVVQIEGWWDAPPAFGFNMGFTAVFDTGHAIMWDMNSGKPLRVLRAGSKEAEEPTLPADDGYYREIEYFLSCVERGEAPVISTPQESRDAVALALLEKQSVLTGERVHVA